MPSIFCLSLVIIGIINKIDCTVGAVTELPRNV